ncbi:MAG: hypothetical protein WCP80_10495 [Phycisphaerales bacterium]
MTQIPGAEANQQQDFEPEQEAGISIADIIHFLRVRAVQLLAIAVITGMISLGAGYFIRMAAGTTKLATYEFAFSFDGAAENKYPNGIPFSPQDVLAAPVLDAVYATMHLQGKIEPGDFRSAFTIARGGIELRLLQSDFEQKLSNIKLTAAERGPLETQYRAALAALRTGTFVLTGDFTNTKLSDLEIERIMSAVPMAWADFAQKIRGVAIYDISVPTMTDADKLTSDSDYLIAAETLRSISRRTSACAEILMNQPGGKLVRDTTGKVLEDLHAEVEASYRVDVLPTYTNFLRLAYAQDSARVNEVFSNRMATSKRAVDMAESEATMTTNAFQNYIMLSSGGNSSSSPADTGRGAPFNGASSSMPMINLNADFFDRIIGQGIAAKDTVYRQKLNDDQLKMQTKVLKLKDDLAFDEWLLKQIQPNTQVLNDNQTNADRLMVESNGGASQANHPPSGAAPTGNALVTPTLSVQATLVSAQAVQNRLAKFAARAREFYTLLSNRNLNASSVLYSSQSPPMVFQTSAISIKQVLVATVAAEFLVLGASMLIMASRRRQHA